MRWGALGRLVAGTVARGLRLDVASTFTTRSHKRDQCAPERQNFRSTMRGSPRSNGRHPPCKKTRRNVPALAVEDLELYPELESELGDAAQRVRLCLNIGLRRRVRDSDEIAQGRHVRADA